jgi:pyruvate/2-oxoglutarate/acetoin dehydrogenase E1 component
VLAPCALGDPGALLLEVVLKSEEPVLFVENKLLYLLPVQGPAELKEFSLRTIKSPEKLSGARTPHTPAYILTIRDAPPPDITITAYGYMAELARQAALKMAYEGEIFAELVIPTQLAPFDLDAVLESADRTGRLLAVEEGTLSLGWGAEVLAQASEALGARLRQAGRVAALDLPIPASGALETAVLPGVEDITTAAQRMVKL